MTLAPQSASWRTQVGPARTRVRSSTVKRARAFEARGKGITGVSQFCFSPPLLQNDGIESGKRQKLLRSCRPCPPARRRCRQSFHAGEFDKMPSGMAIFPALHEATMNEDVLNVSVRKFLKKVGITSQREIEQAVRQAVSGGRLKGNEALPAKMTLTVDGLGLAVEIEGAIELE